MLALPGMSESLSLLDITWAVTTTLECTLLGFLAWRRTYRSFPLFAVYGLAIVLQSVATAVLYRRAELEREQVWNIAWGTQAVVTVMRSLALVELVKKMLARYSGIWAFARRVLLSAGAVVILFAAVSSKGLYQWVILDLIRGLELAIAVVIVAMFLFARYYRLPLHPLPRALAVGLCLYSSFYVLDYSLLQKMVQQYANYWNFLGIVAFLASLLVWVTAVARYPYHAEEARLKTLPPETYGQLSAQVNLRLHLLNRQLSRMRNSGEPRP